MAGLARTVGWLPWIIGVLILVPILILAWRRLFSSSVHDRAAPDVDPPSARPPAQLEAKGEFAAAAEGYLRKGEFSKAAAVFEKAQDFSRAAELYENTGDFDKAVALHLRSGGALRAAGILIKQKKYIEAAKIFKNKGDFLRAAQALEKHGSMAAAAREYKEAGQFARAAKLYREEEFFPEAAECYRLALRDDEPTPGSVESFYTYGAYLLLAGQRQMALQIYRRILMVDPSHAKSLEKVRMLDPSARVPERVVPREARPDAPPREIPAASALPGSRPVEKGLADGRPALEESSLEAEIHEYDEATGQTQDPLERVISLRSMIDHSKLDPKDSMRLWLQMMKALDEKHRQKTYFGCVTPDQVLIDMQNNIRLEPAWVMPEQYTAPEVLGGGIPDETSDVYAMGVILYEMVTGSPEGLGRQKPSDKRSDVPPWLDALIGKCIAMERDRRYRSLAEISNELVQLKNTG